MAVEGRPSDYSTACADLKSNLAGLADRVESAARRAGRAPEEITIVAVTKTVPVETIQHAIALGVRDIGENRVQEARGKFDRIGRAVRWHMIGRLQTNKVKQALKMFDLIHSLDRMGLAEEIDRQARALGIRAQVLIQVNTSREETKAGVAPEEALDFYRRVRRMPGIVVRGLMTIGPLTDDAERARPCFRALRSIFDDIRRSGDSDDDFQYLSMGMTGDFEIAIEEGANIIRVGTAIFGPRLYNA